MKVAIIPARGGSKRVPRKNIRTFAGRPMLSWPIAAARDAGLFDRIIVSSDDAEIAAIAREAGAETPFLRPDDLADAFTGTQAVVRHALRKLAAQGSPADHACCIYATAAFVTSEFLCQGWESLAAAGKDYAFSVTSFPAPIQRALRIREDGTLEPIYPEFVPVRSQDLEPAYHDAGQFYWGRAQAFLDDVPLFSPASVPVVLPRHLVHDIDTEEDWIRAELVFRALRGLSVA